jgi:hypothetical protein
MNEGTFRYFIKDQGLTYCSVVSCHTQFIPGFETELEERQRLKLEFLKRRGKGPPKKGSGARKKK